MTDRGYLDHANRRRGEILAAGMTDRLVFTLTEVLAPTDSPPSSDPQAGLLLLGAPESISVTQPPSKASDFVSPPAPAQPHFRARLLTVGHQPRISAQTLGRNRSTREVGSCTIDHRRSAAILVGSTGMNRDTRAAPVSVGVVGGG